MAEKMRVSMHNGRGNAKHNDRSFLQSLTDDDKQEKAGHIDLEKSKLNVNWANPNAGKTLEDGATFKEIELSFYNKYFTKALEEQNERYINQGHPERCRTMEDWYKSHQKAPFETLMQVGNMHSDIDPTDFRKMCYDYVNFLNKKYGKYIRVLDFSIHHDEQSPHMHLRQVYVYNDNKTLKIGQNKALEQAGIELPDPSKKASRKNNRKVTLDKELRAKWQEIAKSYGYDIETEPRVSVRHKDKEEYINDQIAKKEEQLEQLDKTIETVVKNADSREYKRFNKHLKVLGYSLVSNEELETLKNDFKALESKSNSLETRNKMLQVDSDELKRLKDNPSRLIYEAKQKSKSIVNQAEEQAKSIIDNAKMNIYEYTELMNFKEHWERVEAKFPKQVEQLEKDYQNSKKGGKQRQHNPKKSHAINPTSDNR